MIDKIWYFCPRGQVAVLLYQQDFTVNRICAPAAGKEKGRPEGTALF